MFIWIATSLACFILGYAASSSLRRGHLRRLITRKWENVMGEVWFPAHGEWNLCHVHSPIDPTRQFYQVFSVNEGETYRVAAIDLRKFYEIEHQPAPAMSVVELQDELEKNQSMSAGLKAGHVWARTLAGSMPAVFDPPEF